MSETLYVIWDKSDNEIVSGDFSKSLETAQKEYNSWYSDTASEYVIAKIEIEKLHEPLPTTLGSLVKANGVVYVLSQDHVGGNPYWNDVADLTDGYEANGIIRFDYEIIFDAGKEN